MDAKLEALRKLEEVVEALRGPGGCPWDREQTLPDMSRYLLEETCEAVDAIEDSGGKPSPEVKEELGDVLMNVLLSARIAEEEGSFSIGDVADAIREKLIRRHPHVFGPPGSGRITVSGVPEVLANWNAIKAEEKRSAPAEKRSRLAGVPRSLPALERAYDLGKKAAGVGFDWPGPEGALEKVAEELGEVKEILGSGQAGDALEEELGDLLFAVVNLCRKAGVHPAPALRRTLAKFRERFEAIEERFPDLEGVGLDAMEAVWNEAKAGGARRGPSRTGPQTAEGPASLRADGTPGGPSPGGHGA